MLQTLDYQILLTLSYSAQFQYPLTVAEVVRRWIAAFPTTSLQESTDFTELKQVAESIIRLYQTGLVSYSDGFVFLNGTTQDLFTRRHRTAATTSKFTELEPLITFLRKLPGIAGVAVTGSAALYNAAPDDDVDIMIVTENNRLWLLRPLIVFFAFLSGKRRTWYREEKNSWCFNLWLERGSLAQAKQSRSLYVAYEVCQAQWLLDVDNVKQSFLRQNNWVGRYLPFYYRWCKDQSVKYSVQHTPIYLPLVAEVASALNLVLFVLQRMYMRTHMTRERVSLQAAFFHPRDTKTIVTTGYQKLLADVLEKWYN